MKQSLFEMQGVRQFLLSTPRRLEVVLLVFVLDELHCNDPIVLLKTRQVSTFQLRLQGEDISSKLYYFVNPALYVHRRSQFSHWLATTY